MTVSYIEKEKYDVMEFKKLHEYLEKAFPYVENAAKKEIINECSLLYHIKGCDNSLKPILLMAHIDVVPVLESTRGNWLHDAFSGYVDDEFIWGRGALDSIKMN